MNKLFSLLISLCSLALMAQPPTGTIDYDFYSNTPACCDGNMLGYTVEVNDTAGGDIQATFDSVRFYYDPASRIEKMEVFRQPHPDSVLNLDAWLRVAFAQGSSLAHKTTFGEGASAPNQPVDSISYAYDGNGNLQTEWRFIYENGAWKYNQRVHYYRWPGVGDTATLLEVFDNGLWQGGYYRQKIYNADSLLTEDIYYTYENGQMEPFVKYNLTYDNNAFMDTLSYSFYNADSQAFLPEIIDFYKYNNEGLLLEAGSYLTDFLSQELYLAGVATYTYEQGLRTEQHNYHNVPNADTMRYVGFVRYQQNAQGKTTREKQHHIRVNGDTIPGNHYQNFYYHNGYLDSSHLYQRNIDRSHKRTDIVKYYYSNISGIPTRENAKPIVSVFPNPAGNQIFLELKALPRNDIHYRIISMDGQVMDRGQLSPMQRQHQLPVPQATGTYLYHFNIDGRPVIKKVVKE